MIPAQYLKFARFEEAAPGENFRIFHEQSPELDKVTVAGALICKRVLDELVQLCVALTGTCQIDPTLFGRSLVEFAKAGDARGGNCLGMAGADCVQQRTIAFVEEQD